MNNEIFSYYSRSVKMMEDSLGFDEINERLHDDRPDPTVAELLTACQRLISAYEYGDDLSEAVQLGRNAIWNAERRFPSAKDVAAPVVST